MTVWNHLGRDPSPSPSRLWHKSPCSCFGAEKNRFILARLPIFSRRLPVGRPWYYSVSTLVVACAKQEMIIGVSAQHSLIPDLIKCFAPVSTKKSTLRTFEHALWGDAFTLLGQKSISRLKTKPIRCDSWQVWGSSFLEGFAKTMHMLVILGGWHDAFLGPLLDFVSKKNAEKLPSWPWRMDRQLPASHRTWHPQTVSTTPYYRAAAFQTTSRAQKQLAKASDFSHPSTVTPAVENSVFKRSSKARERGFQSPAT